MRRTHEKKAASGSPRVGLQPTGDPSWD
jgi:hypothetical protein